MNRRLKAFALWALGALALPLAADIPQNISLKIPPTPSGIVDTRFRDGDDGTVIIPLVWGTCPNIAVSNGDSGAVNLRTTCSLSEAGGPAATLATLCTPALSGGFADATDGLAWTTTTTFSASCQTSATRLGVVALSNFYTVASSAVAVSDTTPPTTPVDCTTTSATNSVILACDPSSDPYASGAGTGVSQYDLRLGSAVIHTLTAVDPAIGAQFTANSIGTVTAAVATQAGSAWTLANRSAGFTSTADNGQFLAIPWSGDVVVSARIASFDSTLPFGHCGPMIRESATGVGSKYGFIFQSTDETGIGIRVKNRTADSTGGATLATVAPTSAPGWLKIKRIGNTFTYSLCPDGSTCSVVTQSDVPMAASVYVGIANSPQSTSVTGTCEIEQLSIHAPSTLTYTHATGSGGQYSWRARDTAGNNSAYGAAVGGTPSVSAILKKWHPGHGMETNGISVGLSSADISAAIATPNIRYVHMRWYWQDLETARDTYDFSQIQSTLSTLQSLNKRLVIQIQDRRSQNSCSPTGPCGGSPEYLRASEFSGGVAKSGGQFRAMLYLVPVADREIALYRALCQAFDTAPFVEGIVFPESSGFVPPFVAGYNRGNLAAQMVRLGQSVASDCPRTNITLNANFLSGELSYIFNGLAASGVGGGGPDVLPVGATDNPVAGDDVFRGGVSDDASNPILYPIHDYRGQVPFNLQVQIPELGCKTGPPCTTSIGKEGEFTPPQLAAWAITEMHSSHMGWIRSDAAKQTWTDNLLPYLQGNPLAVYSACPAAYLGLCDTSVPANGFTPQPGFTVSAASIFAHGLNITITRSSGSFGTHANYNTPNYLWMGSPYLSALVWDIEPATTVSGLTRNGVGYNLDGNTADSLALKWSLDTTKHPINATRSARRFWAGADQGGLQWFPTSNAAQQLEIFKFRLGALSQSGKFLRPFFAGGASIYNSTGCDNRGWRSISTDFVGGDFVHDPSSPPEVFPPDQWVRVQTWFDSPANTYIAKVNGVVAMSSVGEAVFPNLATNHTEDIGHMKDKPGGPPDHRCDTHPTYNSDEGYAFLVRDFTRNRFEVSDSPSCAFTGLSEIQIPRTWSTTSVTVGLNQGEHLSLSNKYLCHYDSNDTPELIGHFN